MASQQTFVIVGGGLAGATAAQTLREEGFTGRLRLVGTETERPYERPPLSKEYLLGDAERETIFVHETSWYDDHDVELSLGVNATGLDVAAHEVTLDTAERIRYDKALVATGSSPHRLTIPGAGLNGVHYLREARDADRLRTALTRGSRRVLIIGGGWIGLEVAAAARRYGNDVTVVESQQTPLRTALGDELGAMFADLHREQGVHLRLGTRVGELVGSDDQVTGVVTEDGDELSADLVIVGVGVRPNVDVAEAAGLRVDNGIVVDAAMRSSDPDVYAAGDVANAYHPLLGHHLRVEHWDNALHGGPAAARSMLGQDVRYDAVPYFFTDQYDLSMEYAGHAGAGDYDQIIYRGDRGNRQFVAFWLDGGRVVAGMNVNVSDVTSDIQDLIRLGPTVDLDRLADPDTPLADLVPVESREKSR